MEGRFVASCQGHSTNTVLQEFFRVCRCPNTLRWRSIEVFPSESVHKTKLIPRSLPGIPGGSLKSTIIFMLGIIDGSLLIIPNGVSLFLPSVVADRDYYYSVWRKSSVPVAGVHFNWSSPMDVPQSLRSALMKIAFLSPAETVYELLIADFFILSVA